MRRFPLCGALLVLAGCGGAAHLAGPRYTAESVKAKVESKLVATQNQLDTTQYADVSAQAQAQCVAESSTKLDCTVTDPHLAGGPVQVTVVVDPNSGQSQVTGGQ